MELEPNIVDKILAEFHRSWNLERIKNMSLEEYADLQNSDSLCYWLEYGSHQIGAIGNYPLTKFTIWKPKVVESKKYHTLENGYYYPNDYYNSLQEAFEDVKRNIVSIVENTFNENYAVIEHIEYNILPKWKLVFMFSNKKTLSIFSRRALNLIVSGLENKALVGKPPIYELQNRILKFKKEDEKIEYFCHRVYQEFADRKTPKFYLIGSTYGSKSVLNKFIGNGCVAAGFIFDADFSDFMGKSNDEINDYVENNYDENEEEASFSKVRATFKKLAKIKEGDIIAVKSMGSFNRLTIVAYAQVVKKNGTIYEYNNNVLGHQIHVDFLDYNFSNFIGENYADTIHELTKKKHGSLFDSVFGFYADLENQELIDSIDFEAIEVDEFEIKFDIENSFQYNRKSEESYDRTPIKGTKVNRIHNLIQNKFLEFLKDKYKESKIGGERRYIDAFMLDNEKLFLYEIKPFASPSLCIREGIGQLLDYTYNIKTEKSIILAIVGPETPNENDIAFINFVRNSFKIDFKYISFNYNSKSLIEY